LILGPPLVYVYVVFPIAEESKDRDGLEFLGFFGGLLVMMLGAVLGLIATGFWLYLSRHGEDIDSEVRDFV